jgi:hypothetical protein
MKKRTRTAGAPVLLPTGLNAVWQPVGHQSPGYPKNGINKKQQNTQLAGGGFPGGGHEVDAQEVRSKNKAVGRRAMDATIALISCFCHGLILRRLPRWFGKILPSFGSGSRPLTIALVLGHLGCGMENIMVRESGITSENLSARVALGQCLKNRVWFFGELFGFHDSVLLWRSGWGQSPLFWLATLTSTFDQLWTYERFNQHSQPAFMYSLSTNRIKVIIRVSASQAYTERPYVIQRMTKEAH